MTKLAIALAAVGTFCLGWAVFSNYGDDGTRKGWF